MNEASSVIFPIKFCFLFMVAACAFFVPVKTPTGFFWERLCPFSLVGEMKLRDLPSAAFRSRLVLMGIRHGLLPQALG